MPPRRRPPSNLQTLSGQLILTVLVVGIGLLTLLVPSAGAKLAILAVLALAVLLVALVR
jgi:hypothetical protein